MYLDRNKHNTFIDSSWFKKAYFIGISTRWQKPKIKMKENTPATDLQAIDVGANNSTTIVLKNQR